MVEARGRPAIGSAFVFRSKVASTRWRSLQATQRLKGGLREYWAVIVQANWRVIFKFENGDAHVVDYLDYH
ncbi:type II toxin-antitoxin system RelE/ParE family toxin [Kerstersia gyiorum]|uniref:type II toxin-antitoxin system RelE/ParE family toxin n=1 Tax=Kerstersia gyiorum TaxID=206506 RepID=UPI003B43D2B9